VPSRRGACVEPVVIQLFDPDICGPLAHRASTVRVICTGKPPYR
jgi:hypothetical protein